MKLKKIASLALAGIMAVSMLAGCGDNSNSSNTNDSSSQTTTATSVVSTVEKVVKEYNSDVTISYKDNATVNSAISKLFSEKSYNQLVASSNDLINKELAKFFDVTTSATDFTDINTLAKKAKVTEATDEKTYAVVLDYDKAYGSTLVLAANDFGAAVEKLKNEVTLTTTNNLDVDATAEYTVYAYTAEKAETDGTAHTFVIIVMEVDYKF